MACVALHPVRENPLNSRGEFASPFSSHLQDSILIYLTVGGSVIPMHIMDTDSIASVKLRIQTFKGFFVKKQKLVFEGKELARNKSCIRDYGVADGNVLHLVLRLSDLQAITVRTVCGKEFGFYVEKNRNVGYVKQQIARKGQGLVDLKDQELTCDGEALEDQRLIQDICKDNDAVIHFLVRISDAKVRTKPVEKDFEVSIEACDKVKDTGADQSGSVSVTNNVLKRNQLTRDFLLEPILVNPTIRIPRVIQELLKMTSDGLEKGCKPIRSSEGSGGAYLMEDSSSLKYVSVFKPIDEEPMAINNPRGLPVSMDGEGLKKGTRVGQGALREVAAYILDHPRKGQGQRFAGVPPTVMVKCLHRSFYYPEGYKNVPGNVKIGSLQMFMRNIGSCEEMGPSSFPVGEVHKISVLDIRLANADRHAGNILVSKDAEDGQTILIPIDHGYCLPESFEDCTFDWLYWPQAKEPYSQDTIDYIKSLDAEEDIKLLKFHGWELPPECARIFRISTMLLKKGAAKGLTPFSIGSIMCRETLKKKSIIEEIVHEAEEAALPGTNEAAFIDLVSVVMDAYLQELFP